MDQPEIFEVEGRPIAYRLRRGNVPTLMFLPGYASDMEGAKATALDVFAGERGLGMLRLDYSGTGSSGGRFEEGRSKRWLEEALAAVDQLTSGPLIVVGSSMGGWIALHLALQRPERVQALVGIAAAPDFTNWGFADGDTAEQRGLSRGFWESGQRLLAPRRARSRSTARSGSFTASTTPTCRWRSRSRTDARAPFSGCPADR